MAEYLYSWLRFLMPGIEPNVFSETQASYISSQGDGLRYVGAIDIGTNSIHLLVAIVDPLLHTFSIALAEKNTTRLGERDPDSGALSEDAMERSLTALQRFKELAHSYKVEELITAATSAVREAPNGINFLNKIKEDLDINVDLISGTEEARLIYLGVLSGMKFDDRPHVLIDIGGGSTEMILADASDAKALTSTRVGAVRLQRDFIKEDPIPFPRLEFLQTFIEGSLEPAITKISRRIKPGERPVMVATSGTAMALGALVASEKNLPFLKRQGYLLNRVHLEDLLKKLIVMTPNQRRKLVSLSERRAEIIVPGALILQKAMQMIDVNEVVLSERALREGLIFDWMMRQGLLKDRFNFQSNIRERTVIHQAKRFGVNTFSSELVARFALEIYDKTFGVLHDDNGVGRELLWAAAILHSCGKHINRSAYHKHSWYLIRHGELLGYSYDEHLMVAAIARYHRRGLPKKKHQAWQALPNTLHRKTVFDMSLIIRLAVSLVRRAQPIVNEIVVNADNNGLVFELRSDDQKQDLGLEKWSLMNCQEIIQKYKGIKLIVNCN